MASCYALRLAATCMLLLCVGSSDLLARPALASSPPPPSRDDQEQAAVAGELLLRELVEHDVAEELGLLEGQHGDGNVGDICPSSCQTCLVVCAATCVLSKVPIACFANCTVSSSCFGKTVMRDVLVLGSHRSP
ncbi:hypothetical protein SETIT_2G207100v2 [Setaria italica]|uniref:Uncharacterized protein n=2 Tax=Setaria italica TaxID=4555 RepID=A0A368Q1M5_SETIT|nr:uncharacterized protein LOC101754657 [Setaria italica]RCV11694.1 hypothetical protein SETIT_2G207100v2 [Setaria italica]